MSVDCLRKMTAPNFGLWMCLVASRSSPKLLPPPAAPPYTATSATVARNASCGPACGLIAFVSAIVRQVDHRGSQGRAAGAGHLVFLFVAPAEVFQGEDGAGGVAKGQSFLVKILDP